MNWKDADSCYVLNTAGRGAGGRSTFMFGSSTDIIVATPSSIPSSSHLHPQQQQQQQQPTS